jgi:tRNA U38,U39,U40 pseudouridine synthase TruA
MQVLLERILNFTFIFLLLVENASSLISRHDVSVRIHTSRCFDTAGKFASPSVDQDKTTTAAQRTTCSHCSKVLDTRNALFRHIRNDPECSIKAATGSRVELVKASIAFQFGYTDFLDYNENDISNLVKQTKAEQAGIKIQLLLVEALKQIAHSVFNNAYTSNADVRIEVLGATQSSLAKLRHRALAQEDACAAEGDVRFINIMIPRLINSDLWAQIGQCMRKRLAEESPDIELFALKLLGLESKLHAERSATQYTYHYMLPLSWLPDATSLYDWWSMEEALPTQTASNHQNHAGKKLASKPPQSLRQLKAALRSAECRKLSAEAIRDDTLNELKTAAGRFGGLGAREKRAWHNFADPSLKGDASPNNEPVWRVVDRARIVDFVEFEDEITAVIEVKGDGFVKEQIRRIVGSAVAMTHGWLPHNFFDLATSNQKFLETPIAPHNRLYLSSVRYHFDEMQSDGLPFFEHHETRNVIELCPPETRSQWAQSAICRHASKQSAETEIKWLRNLEDIFAPRIQKELQRQGNCIISSNDATCPELYEPVLSELRRISSNRLWPETSMARSAVIRHQEKEHGTVPLQNGSFTIVNPNVERNWDSLPLGNSLFPELVSAIFVLEASLSQHQKATQITVDDSMYNVTIADRPASSHCAVNCNAQFTPHVDSGRGSGQKLSMIVGLGDYSGGKLRVEGDSLDIQYKPLVFDGWKLRHWTNPFAGERFSLVWFTPEAKK